MDSTFTSESWSPYYEKKIIAPKRPSVPKHFIVSDTLKLMFHVSIYVLRFVSNPVQCNSVHDGQLCLNHVLHFCFYTINLRKQGFPVGSLAIVLYTRLSLFMYCYPGILDMESKESALIIVVQWK